MSVIAFTGSPKASPEAMLALDYLGRVLAHQDVLVTLIPKGAANNALLCGYNAKAEERNSAPVYELDKDILKEATDQLMVYGSDVATALDKHSPGWRERNKIYLPDEEALGSFLELLLATIKKETGQVIEPL